jgi:hypothetical protein
MLLGSSRVHHSAVFRDEMVGIIREISAGSRARQLGRPASRSRLRNARPMRQEGQTRHKGQRRGHRSSQSPPIKIGAKWAIMVNQGLSFGSYAWFHRNYVKREPHARVGVHEAANRRKLAGYVPVRRRTHRASRKAREWLSWANCCARRFSFCFERAVSLRASASSASS